MDAPEPPESKVVDLDERRHAREQVTSPAEPIVVADINIALLSTGGLKFAEHNVTEDNAANFAAGCHKKLGEMLMLILQCA